MELIVKPTELELDDYINAGCNAFLFSIDKFSSCITKSVSLKTLKDLINKYSDVDFYLQLDANFFQDDLKDLKRILRELVKLRIKGILFYDLGLLNIVLEEGLDLPLILNQNYLVNNSSTCNYYESFGVKGIVLPSEITALEMVNIKKKVNVSLYVNLFGYQMMAFSKRKLVKDYFDHIKSFSFKKNHDLLFEGKKYSVMENDNGTVFRSDFILNSFDYLKDLKVLDYGILDEFNLPHDNFLIVIKTYNDALVNDNYDGMELDELFDDLDSGFLNKKTIYKVK